jgi:hypothetical protein
MAPWIPMGSEESMMIWFGSVDVGSAVIDADRLSQDFAGNQW